MGFRAHPGGVCLRAAIFPHLRHGGRHAGRFRSGSQAGHPSALWNWHIPQHDPPAARTLSHESTAEARPRFSQEMTRCFLFCVSCWSAADCAPLGPSAGVVPGTQQGLEEGRFPPAAHHLLRSCTAGRCCCHQADGSAQFGRLRLAGRVRDDGKLSGVSHGPHQEL